MDRILIDSDVILDLLFKREPFVKNAAVLLGLCETGKIKGFLTPVIISNLYYLLRREATHQKVITKLKQLLMVLDVLQMDRDVVVNALNSEFKDFEDALQNFSAVKSGRINVVITRNLKDYRKSSLTVLEPEEYLQTQG